MKYLLGERRVGRARAPDAGVIHAAMLESEARVVQRRAARRLSRRAKPGMTLDVVSTSPFALPLRP